MNTAMKTVWIFAAAAFAGLALVSVSQDAVGGDKKAKKKIVNLETHEIVGELKAAHKYLELANHDYKGHRAKAAHEIHQAIQALENHHKANHKTKLVVTVPHPHPHHHKRLDGIKEPQLLSDTQVLIAGDIAKAVQTHITALPNNKHTTVAAKHVTDAVAQVQLALAASPLKK